MPNLSIDINSKELVAYTNKLEKLHKSALPVAVRQTLNDLAFDLKTNSLPQKFQSQFKNHRRKNVIKSHSGVQKSKNTFDISQMESEAGLNGGKKNDKLGERLEENIMSKSITDRATPIEGARISQKKANKVSGPLSYGKLKSIKRGGFRKVGGKRIIRGRDSIYYRKGKKKRDYIRLYQEKVNFKHSGGDFMTPAVKSTMKELGRIYEKHARGRIEKYR
jgi:hypothetical protein